jgi:hypothetical protein
VDGRAGQRGDVGGAPEVVRVQVRDDDPLHRRVELGEHGRPLGLGIVGTETRVDQRP